MSVSSRNFHAPPAVVLFSFAGAAAALVGGYWDDAWHTDRGRDDFFIAPHIAIYGGVATVGAALSVWALLAARMGGLRAITHHRPLTLALLSVVVTLASGPIDNAWHVAFGRDAVIWSPPHMLGIAGTAALGAALLADLGARTERWAATAAAVAAALVLAALAFVTVEYDTDVPQFSDVFYLPVLGLAAGIALVLVRTALGGRWAATGAAAVHAAFLAAIGAVLLALDFPPPALPLLLAAAAVVDHGSRATWTPVALAAGYTAALHAAYVPVRNWFGDGVRFDAVEVLVSLPLTFAGALLVFSVATGPAALRRTELASLGLACALVATLAAPVPAVAHDPGQGEDAGAIAMTVDARNGVARVTADVDRRLCASTTPRAVVARRGGTSMRGTLTAKGCRHEGSVRLPERGRWFVYAELTQDGRAVESWLPVVNGERFDRTSASRRYAYEPPSRDNSPAKLIGGVVLYAGMLALLYAAFILIRGSRSGPIATG